MILRHSPRFAGVEECFDVAFAYALFCGADLVRHQVFVTGVSDAAEDADGVRHVSRVAHPCKEVRQGGVLGVLIVDDEILSGVFAVCGVDDFGLEAVQPDTLIAFCSENEGFVMLQKYRVVSLRFLFCVLKEGSIVKHIAVLVDFDERGAFVFKR